MNRSEAVRTKWSAGPQPVPAGQTAQSAAVPDQKNRSDCRPPAEGGGGAAIHGPSHTSINDKNSSNGIRTVTHLCIVAEDHHPHGHPDPNPTDDQLWLEDIARQVEADARPLFAHALAYLFRRALELDDNQP